MFTHVFTLCSSSNFLTDFCNFVARKLFIFLFIPKCYINVPLISFAVTHFRFLIPFIAEF